MISTLKFPFEFDAEKLKSDLRKFASGDWTPHFNTGYYEGDWSGIALRAAKDAHMQLYPDPTRHRLCRHRNACALFLRSGSSVGVQMRDRIGSVSALDGRLKDPRASRSQARV